MGRKTFAATGTGMMGGASVVVFSRTLNAEDHPGVRVVGDGAAAVVSELKAGAGKDIWLFGGGDLFRSLLAEQLVDVVEVAIIPILLGGGLSLLPAPATRAALELKGTRTYPTGIILLDYQVRYQPAAGKAKRRRNR